MCILLWTAINTTFWVCDLDSIPYITNSPVSKNKTIQFQNNFTTNNTISIDSNYTENGVFNLTNYNIENSTIFINNTISQNNTLEHNTLQKTENNTALFNLSTTNNTHVNNSHEVINFSPSPSKKNLRNRLSPSPIISINSDNIDKYSDNVIIDLDKNNTNSTNSSYLDKTHIQTIEIDNLVFLHFLWLILPLICFYGHIYKKKTNKSNKIGCFNFTTKNKLKRCKSMPNLYAAIPTALPKRMAVSDSEIDVVVL